MCPCARGGRDARKNCLLKLCLLLRSTAGARLQNTRSTGNTTCALPQAGSCRRHSGGQRAPPPPPPSVPPWSRGHDTPSATHHPPPPRLPAVPSNPGPHHAADSKEQIPNTRRMVRHVTGSTRPTGEPHARRVSLSHPHHASHAALRVFGRGRTRGVAITRILRVDWWRSVDVHRRIGLWHVTYQALTKQGQGAHQGGHARQEGNKTSTGQTPPPTSRLCRDGQAAVHSITKRESSSSNTKDVLANSFSRLYTSVDTRVTSSPTISSTFFFPPVSCEKCPRLSAMTCRLQDRQSSGRQQQP